MGKIVNCQGVKNQAIGGYLLFVSPPVLKILKKSIASLFADCLNNKVALYEPPNQVRYGVNDVWDIATNKNRLPTLNLLCG